MIKKLLATILPIVFAVLLALALDAWYNGRERQNEIDTALSDIALDIYIYSQQQSAFEFNQSQLDSLTINIERFEQGKPANFNFGYARPELSSLTWEMSKTTGLAAGFGSELYQDIARVYVEFDRLVKLWDYKYDFMLSYDPSISPYNLALHHRRQLVWIQRRHSELEEKSIDFLQKYQDAAFIRAMANSN